MIDLAPLTIAEAISTHVDPPDFVLGHLQPGDLGILSGADGSGKSLVALAMAASVAYGIGCCGVVAAPQHKGKVLYVAGEDRRADHTRRLQRLATYIRAEYAIQDLAESDAITLWPLEGRRMPLVVQDDNRKRGYTVTALGERFAEAIKDYRLVILDPLRMFHDLEESDGPGVDFLARWLVTVAMKNQQAILLVHHASQAAIVNGRDDHHAGRGATDLPAACRAAWTLRGMTTAEAASADITADERSSWRVLVNSKASHGPEHGAVWLQRRGGLWMRSAYTPEDLVAAKEAKAQTEKGKQGKIVKMPTREDNNGKF